MRISTRAVPCAKTDLLGRDLLKERKERGSIA